MNRAQRSARKTDVARTRITRTRGRFRLTADVSFVGDDLLVIISGGSHPHIGAAAMATPRPSLNDPHITSATSSVLTRIGHKEDEIVKCVSERLAAALKTHVIVVAGIHWDGLSPAEIASIRTACEDVVAALIQRRTVDVHNDTKGEQSRGARNRRSTRA